MEPRRRSGAPLGSGASAGFHDDLPAPLPLPAAAASAGSPLAANAVLGVVAGRTSEVGSTTGASVGPAVDRRTPPCTLSATPGALRPSARYLPRFRLRRPRLTSEIDLTTRVRRYSDLPWRRIENEIFIITPDDGGLHNLNEVGARVWELLAGSRDVAGIVDQLLGEYEVERERLSADILGLLAKMRRADLIEVL
ncbi:MAG: PqqD family peptide modification chaperone [Candidatus Coatesbacteria bacterium]|nr:PqqD family peptide modification chaperone [Candidatus Coatesbacteria bacterium]